MRSLANHFVSILTKVTNLLLTGLKNPIDMIYHIQPWMIVGLLPLTIWFEGLVVYENGLNVINEHIGKNIVIGAFFAFLMEMSEYLLLSYTSSLTLSIAGIFKEIFTLYLAIEYNGDVLSVLNFVGLFTCLTGITLHVILKVREATTGKVKLASEISQPLQASPM